MRPETPRTWPAVLLLVAALWTLGFPALRSYNVSWDEALGDLFFGQRYLSYFTSFDAKYLDFAADPYPPGFVPDLRASPLRVIPWEHYPVASTLGAATSALFARALGWLDPFDGYHAMNLLLGALLVAFFVPFAARACGRAAAVLATALLLTAPRVVSEVMANVKDFPLLVAFTLALVAFHRAWERGSTAGIVASGALWGVALGVKANALFLPPVILLTVLVARPPAAWRGRARAVALVPRLRRREGAAVLVAAWIGVVAARLYLPGATNFDGVRHFLELFPPLALLAGLGGAALARLAARPFERGGRVRAARSGAACRRPATTGG